MLLQNFIKGKGISVLEIECLSHKDARTNTFRVKIKAAEYEKAMKPEVWPYRVGVRHYRPKRRTQPSWNDQSAQSGGQIDMQPGAHQRAPRHHHQGYQQHRSQPPQQQAFYLPVNNRYAVDGFQGEWNN